MISKLFAVFVGLITAFVSGTALFTLEFPKNKSMRVGFCATAGLAMFAFVWVLEPYWSKSKPLQQVKPASSSSLSVNGSPDSQPSLAKSEPTTNDQFTADEKLKMDRILAELGQRLHDSGLLRNKEEDLRKSRLLDPGWVIACNRILDKPATRGEFDKIAFVALLDDYLGFLQRKPELEAQINAVRLEVKDAKEYVNCYSEEWKNWSKESKRIIDSEQRSGNDGLYPPDNQNSGGYYVNKPTLDETVVKAFVTIRGSVEKLNKLRSQIQHDGSRKGKDNGVDSNAENK
jgi:hypothetical protein